MPESENAVLASVIIPTYNRCEALQQALASLAASNFPRAQFEVVVVDNNSNDATPTVMEAAQAMGLTLRYVREPRLSFTVARHTGAAIARGRYLLYIDDDVTVAPSWLKAVVQEFQAHPRTGMVCGPIRPVYEAEPPDWLTHCPGLFNGLSLWERGAYRHATHGAPGPNLCVRASVLKEVGGFPPDTMGVEAAGKPDTVEKIYVGNGDYGLSLKVRRAGYQIVYVPEASVEHHIPPVRLTKEWWRARLAGEAYMDAFVDWREHSRAWPLIVLRLGGWAAVRSAKLTVKIARNILLGKHWWPMLDFQWAYIAARLRIQRALLQHPALGDQMWQAALTGVPPQDMDAVLSWLP